MDRGLPDKRPLQPTLHEMRMSNLKTLLPQTPLTGLIVESAVHRDVSLYLKREDLSIWGSMKDRTAIWLICDVLRRVPHVREVIESTSGNLGVAIAAVTAELGLSFTAVVDPRTPPALASKIRELGGKTVTVKDRDESGSYLAARIRAANLLAMHKRDALWLDQYHNPANPAAHCAWTAPEILRQLGRAPGTIFAAVSTGGTARGLYDFFGARGTSIVAVDITGSSALGGPSAPRALTGIGSSLPSAFLDESLDVTRQYVSELAAVSVCRALWHEAGLALGGSSGAVIAACTIALANREVREPIVCICPDGGLPYASTIYADIGNCGGRTQGTGTDALPPACYRRAEQSV
jgi:cysteine synthase